MNCLTESPLISEAEYCYACSIALRELEASEQLVQEMLQASKVEELRERMTPYFQEKHEVYREQPQLYRLLNLLIHSRVEGKITDEVREIMDEK